ncbi:MAG: potassium channel family protein [Muribaculaceae bacterium]|nr:potassium channel family protein [Muribaculaceae bacterium]
MRVTKGIQWSLDAARMAVFVLSALLIVFISYDTFTGRDFLRNTLYMRFQFWMCIFFIFDFFYELVFAPDRRRYLKTRWLFLLLSIPYLNIITQLQIPVTATEIYWVRFIPLGRATMALAIVVGYLSKNRVSSLLASYIMILVAFVYFGSIIFFNAEHGPNPDIHTYWNALWWACMDVTTIGCDIQPVTVIGKVVSSVLAVMGVLVFPLFTVYVTSLVTRFAQSPRSGSGAQQADQ